MSVGTSPSLEVCTYIPTSAGVGVSLLTMLPSEAKADMTLNSFKKSYFRWVPRIEAGRDFFVLELGAAIENEQWSEVCIYVCMYV